MARQRQSPDIIIVSPCNLTRSPNFIFSCIIFLASWFRTPSHLLVPIASRSSMENCQEKAINPGVFQVSSESQRAIAHRSTPVRTLAVPHLDIDTLFETSLRFGFH